MTERLLLLFERYPLDYISGLSSSLPILIGLFRYKYLTVSQWLILLFFLLYLTGDAYTIWLGANRQNNLFVLNFYPIAGILILAGAYSLLLKQELLRKTNVIVAISLALICIVLFKWDKVSSAESFIYRIYITLLVLLHFNQILTDLHVRNILVHVMFWVNAGLIIYALGTLFIALFSNIIFDPAVIDDITFNSYWNLNNILFVVMASLAALGLWFSKQDQENLT